MVEAHESLTWTVRRKGFSLGKGKKRIRKEGQGMGGGYKYKMNEYSPHFFPCCAALWLSS